MSIMKKQYIDSVYNWLPGDEQLRVELKSYLLANPMNIRELASKMGLNQLSVARFIEGKQSLVLRTRILVYNYLKDHVLKEDKQEE